MRLSTRYTQCCGVEQITGISSIKPMDTNRNIVDTILGKVVDPKYEYGGCNCAACRANGRARVLAHYIIAGTQAQVSRVVDAIQEFGLGACLVTDSITRNGKSVVVCVWTPDKRRAIKMRGE